MYQKWLHNADSVLQFIRHHIVYMLQRFLKKENVSLANKAEVMPGWVKKNRSLMTSQMIESLFYRQKEYGSHGISTNSSLEKNSFGLLIRKNSIRIATLCVMIGVAFFYSMGCGSSSQLTNIATDGSSESESQSVDNFDATILTGNYSGTLVVHLDKNMKSIITGAGKLMSRASDHRLLDITNAISKYSSATIRRSTKESPMATAVHTKYMKLLAGHDVPDLNSIVYVDIADRQQAHALRNILKKMDGISHVYPFISLLSVADDGIAKSMRLPVTPQKTRDATENPAEGVMSIPDLSDQQGYLYSFDQTGGVDTHAFWDSGAYGQGVVIMSMDGGVNLQHEELAWEMNPYLVDSNGHYYGVGDHCIADGMDNMMNQCQMGVLHGTATASILVARHDGQGMDGISPQAHYVNHSMLNPSTLGDYDDPAYEEISPYGRIAPGSVYLITYMPNIDLPVEAIPMYYEEYQLLAAYGVTPVLSAGNSGYNFDDPAFYNEFSDLMDLREVDSGSIIVGASMGEGQPLQKADFSNCGRRVDLFSWGMNVVSAGTGDILEWQNNDGVQPLNQDPNRFYTDSFNGTSAAAPIIAGTVALVQSYVKNEMGSYRFMMPVKLREILSESGLSQNDDGCNIGKQPQLDQAKQMIDAYLSQTGQLFQELSSNTSMTLDNYYALRDTGLGLICLRDDQDHSDPACPEELIHPQGLMQAYQMDFDLDMRSDIVHWNRGKWRLDLSSQGDSDDGFGSWDIVSNYTAIDSKWVVPYVADMNADGMTDLVVYDKEHATWYIKYMSHPIVDSDGFWDEVVDYPDMESFDVIDVGTNQRWHHEGEKWVDHWDMDPMNSQVSRPFIADMNGDQINDLMLIGSDGLLRIDLGGAEYNGYGEYEIAGNILPEVIIDNTPGWAYTVYMSSIHDDSLTSYRNIISVRSPDVEGENPQYAEYEFMITGSGDDFAMFTTNLAVSISDPSMLIGNDLIIAIHDRPAQNSGQERHEVRGFKRPNGNWDYIEESNQVHEGFPGGVFGGAECQPIIGDYDGDLKLDRAVLCPNQYRVVYTDQDVFKTVRDDETVRSIEFVNDDISVGIPGRSMAGGVSYEYTKELIAIHQRLYPNTPPPIIVDSYQLYDDRQFE